MNVNFWNSAAIALGDLEMQIINSVFYKIRILQSGSREKFCYRYSFEIKFGNLE
ncbi:hypothetical protein GCM10011346_29350 [Oceanobacillus neutriphilus]|uniref:Uncharacterized protein n=1 Tax=Oceanobacillus neutriphilus TaxID=531815 RepID=A0ABQ2NWZ5_9BACI|nr:hypothetical protein GCM10011346_29350 [Oceanobacillus neutriphilus]